VLPELLLALTTAARRRSEARICLMGGMGLG
jgi:hypothetical protein